MGSAKARFFMTIFTMKRHEYFFAAGLNAILRELGCEFLEVPMILTQIPKDLDKTMLHLNERLASQSVFQASQINTTDHFAHLLKGCNIFLGFDFFSFTSI